MTQIDLTLRGIPAERVAAVLAAIGGSITIDASLVPATNEVTQVPRDQFPAPAPEPIIRHDDVGNYTPTEHAYNPAPAGTPTVGYNPGFQSTPAGAEEYQPYNPNIAAGVFGAKGAPLAANPQGGYVPQALGATAQPLANQVPAAFAAGGTPATASNEERDAAGHTWDIRIHPESREKLAKTKEWKLKRNVDKLLVARIYAEQDLARGALGATPAAQVPQGVTRINDVVQLPGAQSMPQVFAAGVAGYAPPAPAVQAGPTYGDVTLAVTGAIAGGKVPHTTIGGLFQHLGIADIADLERHPQHWGFIISEINRLSGAQ